MCDRQRENLVVFVCVPDTMEKNHFLDTGADTTGLEQVSVQYRNVLKTK